MSGDLPKPEESPTTDPKAQPTPKPDATPKPGDRPDDENLTDEKAQEREEAEARQSGDKKRIGPWKLVKQYKDSVKKYEAEIAELKKGSQNGVPKEFEEKLTKTEQRAKELEDHMRYVDYTKSKEFTEKYEAPYNAAWQRAMSELGELEVNDPNSGDRRAATVDDVLDLVNMPIQAAQDHAEAIFGKFAGEAMMHRKEIKTLFKQQQDALKDAKEKSTEYFKRMQADREKSVMETNKSVSEHWKRFNDEAPKDEKYGRFFLPMDGDEEGNKRLKNGFALADKAFSISSTDPRLTPQEREEAVRVHAAVRNRAASAGRLMYWHARDQAEIANLKSELEKYKNATPGSGDGKSGGSGAPSGPASAKQGAIDALRKLAR